MKCQAHELVHGVFGLHLDGGDDVDVPAAGGDCPSHFFDVFEIDHYFNARTV